MNGYGGRAFRGRSETSDANRSECLEKGRGSNVGQNNFEKPERERLEGVCYTVMPVLSGTVALTEQQQRKFVRTTGFVE